MDWKQLYNRTTEDERLELTLEMLRKIEARQHRLVLVKGWFQRERRQRTVAHFIGDRRILYKQRRRRKVFTVGLTVATVTSWIGVIFLQPIYGALLLTASNLALISILLVKPYLRWQPMRANG